MANYYFQTTSNDRRFDSLTDGLETLGDALCAAERRARECFERPRDADDGAAGLGEPFRFSIDVGIMLGTEPESLCKLVSSGLSEARWLGIDRPTVFRYASDAAERDVDAGLSALRRAHYASVRDFAIEALRQVASGDIGDSESFDDFLSESIDGCQEVIYTYKAKMTLLASDNEDAMSEELGEDGTPEQRAYFAIRADVRDLLDALLPIEFGSTVEELTEEQVRILAAGGDGGTFDVNDDDTYPASLTDADSIRDSIVVACAELLNASAFASACESLPDELRSRLVVVTAPDSGPNAPRTALPHSFAGLEWSEAAPPVTEEATSKAESIVKRLEEQCQHLGKYFLTHVLPSVREDGGAADGWDVDGNTLAERFGTCVAFESLGHGVGWTDDYPEHGLTMPHSEFEGTWRVEPTDDEPFELDPNGPLYRGDDGALYLYGYA